MKTETSTGSNGGQAHMADKIIAKEFENQFGVKWPEPYKQDLCPGIEDEKMRSGPLQNPPAVQIPPKSEPEEGKTQEQTGVKNSNFEERDSPGESHQEQNEVGQNQGGGPVSSSSSPVEAEKEKCNDEIKAGNGNNEGGQEQNNKAPQMELGLNVEVSPRPEPKKQEELDAEANLRRARKKQERRNSRRMFARLKKIFEVFLTSTSDKVEKKNVFEANRRLKERSEKNPFEKFPPEYFVKTLADFFRSQDKIFYADAKAIAKRIPLFAEEKLVRKARKMLGFYVKYYEKKYGKPFSQLIQRAKRRTQSKSAQIST